MNRTLARINWPVILAYLLLIGGLSALTVFLTTEGLLDVTLAITLLLAVSGGIAFTFFVFGEGRGWRWMAALLWIGAAPAMTVYLIVEGWVNVALAVAAICFLMAGGILYMLFGRSDTRTNPSEKDVPLPR